MFHLLRSKFGAKIAAVLVVATVILFATNPEMMSLVLVANTIGLDFLILLIGFQVRGFIEVPYRFFVGSISALYRRLGKRKPKSKTD